LSHDQNLPVSKEGPEWSIPVEAWTDKETADKRAADLDQQKPFDIYSDLSKHVVTTITLFDKDK